MPMSKLWRDHSLSIVLSIIGVGLISIAMALQPGKMLDLLLGLGSSFATVAMVNLLAGPLVERNKPEKPK
jgi:hypothetical protein